MESSSGTADKPKKQRKDKEPWQKEKLNQGTACDKRLRKCRLVFCALC